MKRIIGRGRKSGGLYIFDTEVPKFVAYSGVLTLFELHCRLGHPSLSMLNKLYPQFSSLSSLNCESCQYAKLPCVHLSPKVNNRAFATFELVHLDVWCPCPVVFPMGFRYFVTFVNDFSRTTWLYLIKNHFELFSHFCPLCAEIHTQFHVYVQNMKSDNAKEYMSDFNHSCFRRTYFIRHLVLILFLKMEFLKEKIDMFLKPLELYCFKCMCPSTIGPMLFPPLVF